MCKQWLEGNSEKQETNKKCLWQYCSFLSYHILHITLFIYLFILNKWAMYYLDPDENKVLGMIAAVL